MFRTEVDNPILNYIHNHRIFLPNFIDGGDRELVIKHGDSVFAEGGAIVSLPRRTTREQAANIVEHNLAHDQNDKSKVVQTNNHLINQARESHKNKI